MSILAEHVVCGIMDVDLELIPSIVMTIACIVGAVGSFRFANKVEESP